MKMPSRETRPLPHRMRASEGRSCHRTYECRRFGKCCTNHLGIFTSQLPQLKLDRASFAGVGGPEGTSLGETHPCSAKIARAQSGITLDLEEGELDAEK
jgi:hypothetical protein